MAGQSDGSIIIDTELDNKGFDAGSKRLQSAINSLKSTVSAFGRCFEDVFTNNTSTISAYDSEINDLESNILELESELEKVGNTKTPTEDYQFLTSKISEADKKLEKLEDRQAKMKSMGVKESSQAWKSLQYDIDLTRKELSHYKAEQSAMENNGTAFDLGVNTAEYAQLESSLSAAKARLAELKAEADTAKSPMTRLQSVAAGVVKSLAKMGANAAVKGLKTIGSVAVSVKNGLSKIGQVGVSGFKKLVSGIKSGISHLRNMKKESGGAEGAISMLTSKLTGLWSMLKRRLMRTFISSIISGCKEGIQNLAQYSAEVNADMSVLMSSLTQLKNSFATAFAPILTVVTPILKRLIDYLIQAVTWVGKFVAALTGAKSFTVAKAVQQDYAASLDKTSNSAKKAADNTKKVAKETKKAAKEAEKAQNQLAGFDDLNILSDSSKSNNDNNDVDPDNIADDIADELGTGLTTADMFEEVPIESAITDFVNRLKEAFRNGDYAEIGRIIGEKINEVFQKIHDFISWDNVGGVITKYIKAFAEAFNSLIYTIDWTLIGDTFAEGINTLINTVYLLITEIDWPALTAGISTGLSSSITGIDWSKLGLTLATGVLVALRSIHSAVNAFDFAGVGRSIANGINAIVKKLPEIAKEAAGTLSDSIKGRLDLAIGFIENVDWQTLGKNLWQSLVNFVTTFDWKGVVEKAFHLLGSIIGGASALIYGLGQEIWKALKAAWESVKEYFSGYMNEQGKLTWDGFCQGVIDALKNVGNWIVEHIWNPFIEGFKNAFGIHSPSTKMAEQGGFIIDGLWNGINGSWTNITGFFSEKLSALKTTISERWTEMKTDASTKWNSIKTDLTEKWNSIKSSASEKFEGIRSTVSSKLENIKSNSAQKWGEIKNDLSEKLNSIKTSASQSFESINSSASDKSNNTKTNLISTWNNVKSSLGDILNNIKTTSAQRLSEIAADITGRDWFGLGSNIGSGIKNGLENSWNWLKDTVKNLATKLLNEAKEALGIHSPSRLFRDTVGLNIGLGVGEGIEASESSVLGTVSDMADAISAEMKNGNFSFSTISADSGLESSLIDFSDTVINGFSDLMNRLQSIADSVTFSMPVVAQNGLVPYRVSDNTNKPNGGDYDAITASNDELSATVVKVVAEAASEIVEAIRIYGGGKCNGDITGIASGVIAEINRRTKMLGTSPLLD